MTHNKGFWFILWSSLWCLSSLLVAQPVPVISPGAAQTCGGCHGPDGNSVMPEWPKLAAQHAKYFIKQIKNYREGPTGRRYNAVMSPLVANLTEEQIRELADYYEQQAISPGYADPQEAALGERLYRVGDRARGLVACAACHGPGGAGNAEVSFPRLAGQHAAYTVAQMIAFREGKRRNGVNGMMGDIARAMTDAEIKAVSSYIEGLYQD